MEWIAELKDLGLSAVFAAGLLVLLQQSTKAMFAFMKAEQEKNMRLMDANVETMKRMQEAMVANTDTLKSTRDEILRRISDVENSLLRNR